MKRWKKLLAGLLAMAMVLSGAPGYGSEVKAADVSGDFEYEVSEDEDSVTIVSGDFEYEVGEDGDSVTITKYTGSDEKVEIPSDMDGKKVISIGSGAFSGCSHLTGVTIPNSVTIIEGYAFKGCIGVTGITIPNSVTSIGRRAFLGCIGLEQIKVEEGNPKYDSRDGCNAVVETERRTLVLGCKNTVIPNNVTSIWDGAFSGCSGLTGIMIPNSVTSIGDGAFEGCSGLTGITIPDSVIIIGEEAFSGCSGLTGRITIPDSVESIRYGTFDGCSGLTGITIPDSVTSIGEHAFENCSGLTGITIPNNVASIGKMAFKGCSGLTGITIPNSVTSIWRDTFSGCSGLTEIKIPDNVTSISERAFSGCIGLTEITIPNSVTSISGEAFSGCSGLEQIKVEEGNPEYDSRDDCNAIIERESSKLVLGCKNTIIPNSVTSIRWDAFKGCIGLTGITIPNSVTSISGEAFSGCIGLEQIKVEEGNPEYDSRDGCNAVIERESSELVLGCKNTVIPNSVKSIGYSAFSGCSGLKNITIPDSVTSISERAFSGCIGLKNITIPDSVTSIGDGAFSDCSNLMGIMLPDSVTIIRERAFKGCSKLADITLPDSVTIIGYETFSGCISLTDITLPDNVASIGTEAFFGCIGLTDITIPGSVTSISDRAIGWYWEEEVGEAKKIPGFIIYGVSGSEAERYAKGNGFEFRLSSSQGDNAIDISKAVVTLSKTSYTYDGTAKTPSVTVELDGKRLSVDKDYTVSYSSNVKVGTARVTVTGKGGYTGSRTVSFTIDKAADSRPVDSIACKKILYKVAYGAKPFKISASSNSRMSFTSSNPKVAAVGKDTGKVTVKGTGVATITIKAGGAFKKVTVKVSPKKQAVKSAKAVKGRKLTVKWAKDKRASGYQVQVSTSRNFKKGVKKKDVSKTSYTFTKLKPGKKYYIRIRSYKKSGKEKLYGAWSKTKRGGKVKK